MIEKTGGLLVLQGETVRVELEPRDVVSVVPLENKEPPGFWKLITGSIDLGYSFTRGNSAQTQSSAAARGEYRTPTYKAQGRLSSIFSETDEAEPTSRHALDARLDRFISPKVFAFGLAGLERNERQNLDLRSKFGGGFGWTLADSERNQLNVLGGFTVTTERFRPSEDIPDPNNSFGEGLLGVEWETVPLFNIRYSTKLSVHPNLVEGGRYRIEYDSSLRIPVLNAFTLSFSLFDRYDSSPPTDVKRNDYGLVSAFGFAF
jgi:putative salt-induced outer membrane protein YdiY